MTKPNIISNHGVRVGSLIFNWWFVGLIVFGALIGWKFLLVISIVMFFNIGGGYLLHWRQQKRESRRPICPAAISHPDRYRMERLLHGDIDFQAPGPPEHACLRYRACKSPEQCHLLKEGAGV